MLRNPAGADGAEVFAGLAPGEHNAQGDEANGERENGRYPDHVRLLRDPHAVGDDEGCMMAEGFSLSNVHFGQQRCWLLTIR
jgi:hypothetical protein